MLQETSKEASGARANSAEAPRRIKSVDDRLEKVEDRMDRIYDALEDHGLI